MDKLLKNLQTQGLEKLQRKRKIKKIRIPSNDNLYFPRAGRNKRILFSYMDNQIMVHDIIDIKDKNTIISLSLNFKKITEKLYGYY